MQYERQWRARKHGQKQNGERTVTSMIGERIYVKQRAARHIVICLLHITVEHSDDHSALSSFAGEKKESEAGEISKKEGARLKCQKPGNKRWLLRLTNPNSATPEAKTTEKIGSKY